MSDQEPALLFERPVLVRTAPKRGAANYYKSASGNRHVLGGVPLDSVEDAAASAIRMGYKIAEAQVDRAARLGKRLREAGDRAAGPASDRQALDATEQLIFRTMMAGLSWLEGVAAGPGHPLKRLAAAEYRILGSLLGFTTAESATSPVPEASPARTPASGQPGPSSGAVSPASAPLRIRHAGSDRRAVRVCDWELDAGTPDGGYDVTFYPAEGTGEVIAGMLAVDRTRQPMLTLDVPRAAAPGRWRAAVCDREGLQLGHIEIAL